MGCLLAGLGAGVQTLRSEDVPVAKNAKLPFTVYDEKGGANNHYASTGWMGNTKAVKMDDGCPTNPHSGKTCLRVEYSDPANWAGVVWQNPANDWGDKPGGWNLTGAKKLKFWARGDKGGETVSFIIGVFDTGKKYPDSASGKMNDVKLTPEWTEYSIDLDGKNLTCIKSGFEWLLAGQDSPVVFYLDDVRYE